ncbi:hypothetical protein [Rouxiella chamberiensis]|uniref:Uncharacterized protein n=1 Tax=Rouxiella chamberiensis TaxID=1513468 RepID=A0ABY7HQY2_9GAMM|nr:hypothetical protein [Rouxiella chamberiensis]WAT01807.1 hypothetical protein O1V66_03575 [Rouxiella chamberiensis]
MPNSPSGALNSIPASSMVRQLLTTSRDENPHAIARLDNTSAQPCSSRARSRYMPYSIPRARYHKEPSPQPLDLRVKSQKPSSPVASTSATVQSIQTPYADKFMAIPEVERERLYNNMMARAIRLTVPIDYTGANVSLEMRAAGMAYLMGIPVYHPLVIRDIAQRTMLTATRLQTAVLHFSRAYQLHEQRNGTPLRGQGEVFELMQRIAEKAPVPSSSKGTGE